MCGVIVTGQLRVVGSCILIAEDHDNDDRIVQEVFHLMFASGKSGRTASVSGSPSATLADLSLVLFARHW